MNAFQKKLYEALLDDVYDQPIANTLQDGEKDRIANTATHVLAGQGEISFRDADAVSRRLQRTVSPHGFDAMESVLKKSASGHFKKGKALRVVLPKTFDVIDAQHK